MKIVGEVLTLLLLVAFAGMAATDDWPMRRLRIVVPFPAGGSGDVQVRIVADELAKVLGQPVWWKTSQAPAAGSPPWMSPTRRPTVYADGRFGRDTRDQCQPLFQTPIRSDQGFRAANTNDHFSATHRPRHQIQGNSLANLIASLKADGSKANFGSSGIGSPTHLAGELFKTETGADIVHVPYRGQGPAAADLLAGELQVMFPSVPDTLAFITSGKLRALAITSDRRLKLLPQVPTTVELGWPKLLSSFWAGLYTTAGTPQPVLDRLNRELMQIVIPRLCGSARALGFKRARQRATNSSNSTQTKSSAGVRSCADSAFS